jgi:geranylgeranyl transferase type-2 subunit beta
MHDIGRRKHVRPTLIERFLATELEFPTGGFRGAAWDDMADAEYTFYGLGALGLLLAGHDSEPRPLESDSASSGGAP